MIFFFFRKRSSQNKETILKYRNKKLKYNGESNEKREPNVYGTLYYKNCKIKYK